MRCYRFEKQIDAYLRGELPEKQQEAFECHYFSCKKCFDQLRIRRSLMQTNFDLTAVHLPGKDSGDAFPLRTIRKSGLVAASLILLVGAGFFGLRWHRNLVIERISVFDPPTIMITETRSPGDNVYYIRAVKAYQKENYDGVLQNLADISAEENSPKILFLEGISRLMVHDSSGAIEAFNRIIEVMAPSYFDEALYYKGIALLRQGRIREARELFVRLEGMFSPLRTQARQKLDTIKNNR